MEGEVQKQEGDLKDEIEVVGKTDMTFMKWRTLNPDKPLFLPEGSVRAVMAIFLIIICATLLFQGMVVPEWLISTTSMTIAFYFGGRTKNV
jgi:hypothetical protein